MKRFRSVEFAAFMALSAVYVALRFWRMTESCLWFDEIFSVHAAEQVWGSLLSFVALDLIHPPLFYVLLKLWTTAGGEGLFWLRLFPVVFSVFAIFPFQALCRELKLAFWNRFLALFLFAVNGSLIKYAQEVRMYSLLLCFGLFSMWLFARYFIKGKSFVPLVIVNVILVYTHYFGWFVIGAEVAAILIFQRIKWRRAAVMFAIAMVSFIPWVVAIVRAAKSGTGLAQNIGWMSRPNLRVVFQFVLDLVEPFYYQASTDQPISVFKVSIPVLLVSVVALVMFFANRRRDSGRETQAIYLLGILAGLPVVAAFIASWLLPYSVWGTRHLIIVFAPVAILTAMAVAKVAIRPVRVAAVSLIVLLTGYGFALEAARDVPAHSWCSWEPLAEQAMAARPLTGNVNTYVLEDLVAYHIWFAERDNLDDRNRVYKVSGIDGLAEDKAYFLPRGFDDIKTVDIADVADAKLWLGYRFGSVNENEPPLRNFLLQGYRVVDQTIIDNGGEKAIFLLLAK